MSEKSNRIISGLLIVAVIGGLGVFGIKFAEKLGAFEKYPEPTYLYTTEEAVRPVYSRLSDSEKAVYTCLFDNISGSQQVEINLPYEITGAEYEKIYCILEKQEGDLFYIDSSYYTSENLKKAKIVYRNYSDLPVMQEVFENAKQSALASVPEGADDYTKALCLHDYIIQHSRYITGEGEKYSSTAYGCLVEGSANCEGYAKAFNVLAYESGLQSVLVTGITDKGENHAWNQVNVNGKWYNLDITWDDTGDSDIRHIYFLCDDLNFGRTHYQKNTSFTPFSCDAMDDNYYVHEGFYAVSDEEALDIVLREVQKGNYNISMRFKDSYAYEDFKQKYLTEKRLFEIIYNLEGDRGSGTVSINLTETRSEHCMNLVISK